MATKILPDGTQIETLPETPPSFTLEEFYRHLGCDLVQAIELADGRWMWLDEEGKLKTPLPLVNEIATRLLHAAGGLLTDMVVGPVLITSPLESGQEPER